MHTLRIMNRHGLKSETCDRTAINIICVAEKSHEGQYSIRDTRSLNLQLLG
jgi:hypothetical protein